MTQGTAMISFECQSCGRTLRVSADKAGKAALCPHCREKIRIPAPAPTTTASPKPVAPAGFEVVDDEPAPNPKPNVTVSKPPAPRSKPAVRARPEPPPPEDEDEPPDESPLDESPLDEERPRKKRRRRRKKRSRPPQVSPMLVFAASLVVLVGVWAFAMGLKVFAGVFISGLLAFTFAIIVGLCGRVWFLSVAFSDDAVTGRLCLMFWPYSLYYLITNLEETWKAFVVESLGGMLVAFSLCGGAIYDKNEFAPVGPNFPDAIIDDDPNDDPGPGMPPANPPGRPPRKNRSPHRSNRARYERIPFTTCP